MITPRCDRTLETDKMPLGIGQYPPEYNPKIHGAYNPGTYYGKRKYFICNISKFGGIRTPISVRNQFWKLRLVVRYSSKVNRRVQGHLFFCSFDQDSCLFTIQLSLRIRNCLVREAFKFGGLPIYITLTDT